ncbi:hypothetical protein ANOBCDAF_03493 [Pleomorphomonas sp. T1.2MG-36]|uniref:hypothetical protein n=1 Tax=Pleomorphomonas sp. T1.2MG-36 TaxID=3041167 RepID=UPI0024777B09|nr:hypothetical protein [Pleomorphomonas sp. T1.2MG-36]CAI9415544.1 hypothetical protein ANOBCDAF_03493 [Pleomorphomonas sp. T1.2MG-36]
MLLIVAMSGLLGFVAGVRVRLVPLILLAAIVAFGSGVGASALEFPAWKIALSVILAVTVFELAAFAALSVRAGLSRTASGTQEADAKSARPTRAGAAALR